MVKVTFSVLKAIGLQFTVSYIVKHIVIVEIDNEI